MDMNEEGLELSRLEAEAVLALRDMGIQLTPPPESLCGRALAQRLKVGDFVSSAEGAQLGDLFPHVAKNLFYSRRLCLKACDGGWRMARDAGARANGQGCCEPTQAFRAGAASSLVEFDRENIGLQARPVAGQLNRQNSPHRSRPSQVTLPTWPLDEELGALIQPCAQHFR